MNARENEDADNPPWTAEDFRSARPAAEVVPDSIAQQLVRSPSGSLSLVNAVRAAGPGLVEASIAPFRFSRAA